jgi:acetoin utilization protein AcuB
LNPKAPLTVGEFMTRPVAVAAPETRLRDAEQLMRSYDIRHLPIVDNTRLVGLLTEGDVREALSLQLPTHQAKERLDWAVYRLMNEQLQSLTPDARLSDAVELLIASKAGAVPIVSPESSELVGILSVIDVLRAVRPLL